MSARACDGRRRLAPVLARQAHDALDEPGVRRRRARGVLEVRAVLHPDPDVTAQRDAQRLRGEREPADAAQRPDGALRHRRQERGQRRRAELGRAQRAEQEVHVEGRSQHAASREVPRVGGHAGLEGLELGDDAALGHPPRQRRDRVGRVDRRAGREVVRAQRQRGELRAQRAVEVEHGGAALDVGPGPAARRDAHDDVGRGLQDGGDDLGEALGAPRGLLVVVARVEVDDRRPRHRGSGPRRRRSPPA